MEHIEIEKKFLVSSLPFALSSFESHVIEQAYLCTAPVVRIRRQDETYYLTYKGSGLMAREEYNLPLTEQAYSHLLKKADGTVIRKQRFLIPFSDSKLVVELDVFEAPFAPLLLAEVEFPSIEEANAFRPPSWFGEEVTQDSRYHNSTMSRSNF